MNAAKKQKPETTGELSEKIGGGLRAVAQSLVNISEGLTTIEQGSELCAGMSLLMEPQVAGPIAAAPEMLALLRELVRAGNANTRAAKQLATERLAAGFFADVRAAISKAEG